MSLDAEGEFFMRARKSNMPDDARFLRDLLRGDLIAAVWLSRRTLVKLEFDALTQARAWS
jgi:hypothetical protein